MNRKTHQTKSKTRGKSRSHRAAGKRSSRRRHRSVSEASSVAEHPSALVNTGSEPIPPGATRRAFERETTPEGENLGAKKPYHAVSDPGTVDEVYGAADSNEVLADLPYDLDDSVPFEEGPPYAGPSGGAVGGSPAEGRSSGGRMRGGLKPGGGHRGDSTIGTDPYR